MRLCSVLGIAGAMLAAMLSVPPAMAADGIKANFIASRLATADRIVIAFDQIQRVNPEAEGPERVTRPDQTIVKELKAAGLTVLTDSSVFLGIAPMFNGQTFNRVGNEQGKRTEFVDFQSRFTITLADVERGPEILYVLARSGVRVTSMRYESAALEAMRAEAANEAIDRVLVKAKALAAHAGIAETTVVELAVGDTPGNQTSIMNSTGNAYQGQAALVGGSIVVGPTESVRFSAAGKPAIEVRVTAAVTVVAKRP